MQASHWKFQTTDTDLKDYGRDAPEGIIHKVAGAFTQSMLPATYVNHLVIKDGSTNYTLYEYMDYIKGV